MIPFDDFVHSLGDFANRYSADELRQLHLHVRRLAQVIIAVRRAANARGRSPQVGLDDRTSDRTLSENSTSP